MRTAKLGRIAGRNRLVPRLASLLPAALPAAPATLDGWRQVPKWVLGENNLIGDCTCAAVCNSIVLRTFLAGHPIVPPDSAACGLYRRMGWDGTPGDATDRGAVMHDVLTEWTHGVDVGTATCDSIDAFATIHPMDLATVRSAMALFGGVCVGISMPLAAQTMSDTWDVPAGQQLRDQWEPGSWGGHEVLACGFDGAAVTVITWGAPVRMTWQFWRAYVDECDAVLDRDCMPGYTPIPWEQLAGYMSAVQRMAG